MSFFGKLKNEGLEQSEDRLGGGYRAFDTDIYTGTVKMAYAGKSAGGAQNVTVIVGLGNREYRETIYITNKKGEHWYTDKEDPKKKQPLPGFTTMNDLCLVCTGKELAEQDTEEKMVKIYDYEAKKELPKSVEVLVELLGKPVSLAIVQQLENKSEKQGNDYVPVAETRTTNLIEKVLDPDSKMTVFEATHNATESVFWDSWVERNKGQVRDKRTIKDDGSTGSSGRPSSRASNSNTAPTAGAAQTPRKSLFGARA